MSKEKGKSIKPKILASEDAADPLSRPLLATGAGRFNNSVQFTALRHNSERKAKQVCLQGETDKLRLTLSNFGAAAPAPGFKYYLALVETGSDGRDKAVSLVQPEILGRTERQLKTTMGDSSARSASPAPSTAAEANVDYRTAQTQLGEAFGTKKRKQALSSLEKNQIDIQQLQNSSSNFISRSIEAKSGASSRTPTPLSTASVGLVDNGILPPYSPTAADPDFVFPELIPQFMLSELLSLLPLEKHNAVCDFVLSLAQKCLIEEKKPSLLYLHYLILFSQMTEYQINNPQVLSSTLYGLSAASLQFLLANFTEAVSVAGGKQRHKFSTPKKDRLLAHIIVLALSLHPNWRCSVNDLSLTLKVSITKISQCMKACGCKIVAASSLPGEKNAGAVVHALNGKSYPVKFGIFSAPITFPRPPKRA